MSSGEREGMAADEQERTRTSATLFDETSFGKLLVTGRDAEQVLQTVRGWTDRVDRVVEEVGTAVEPPILAAARNVQALYKGITKFFETFSNRNHNNP